MANTRHRDLEDLRDSAEMERQLLRRQAKQEVEKARSETSVLKQENLMLQEDIQNMKGVMKAAGKRRMVPEWAAPVELRRMLAMPNRCRQQAYQCAAFTCAGKQSQPTCAYLICPVRLSNLPDIILFI